MQISSKSKLKYCYINLYYTTTIKLEIFDVSEAFIRRKLFFYKNAEWKWILRPNELLPEVSTQLAF